MQALKVADVRIYSSYVCVKKVGNRLIFVADILINLKNDGYR